MGLSPELSGGPVLEAPRLWLSLRDSCVCRAFDRKSAALSGEDGDTDEWGSRLLAPVFAQVS